MRKKGGSGIRVPVLVLPTLYIFLQRQVPVAVPTASPCGRTVGDHAIFFDIFMICFIPSICKDIPSGHIFKIIVTDLKSEW